MNEKTTEANTMNTDITQALHRMQTHGGSFASSLAHLYTLADPDNQARIRYAFSTMLESYGHPKPDASDRTDELRPSMTDDALAEWANWAQGELLARLAANVDLKLWHDAAMKRIADLERQVRDGNLQRQLRFERGVAGIEEPGDAESDACSKSLATGATLSKKTWDDFVQRLKYHCEGEGVNDHCTVSALFTVQQKTYDYGIDLDFGAERVIVCDGMIWTTPQDFWDDVEEDIQEELDNMALEESEVKFLDSDIDDQWNFLACLDDHQVIGRKERWEFVGAHFTKEAADAFIARKKHDYPAGLRVYVEAQIHAWEFEAIKSAIMDGRLVLKEGCTA